MYDSCPQQWTSLIICSTGGHEMRSTCWTQFQLQQGASILLWLFKWKESVGSTKHSWKLHLGCQIFYNWWIPFDIIHVWNECTNVQRCWWTNQWENQVEQWNILFHCYWNSRRTCLTNIRRILTKCPLFNSGIFISIGKVIIIFLLKLLKIPNLNSSYTASFCFSVFRSFYHLFLWWIEV